MQINTTIVPASVAASVAEYLAAAERLADYAQGASLAMMGQSGEAADTARDLRIATQEVVRLLRKQAGHTHGDPVLVLHFPLPK